MCVYVLQHNLRYPNPPGGAGVQIPYSVFSVLSHSVMPDSGDPLACSPPGSSAHGILQARILEWVGLPSSRGSSPPRD